MTYPEAHSYPLLYTKADCSHMLQGHSPQVRSVCQGGGRVAHYLKAVALIPTGFDCLQGKWLNGIQPHGVLPHASHCLLEAVGPWAELVPVLWGPSQLKCYPHTCTLVSLVLA